MSAYYEEVGIDQVPAAEAGDLGNMGCDGDTGAAMRLPSVGLLDCIGFGDASLSLGFLLVKS